MVTIKTPEDIKAMPTETWGKFKFSIITREVYRFSKNKFEIHDTSSGWLTTIVDLNTMIDLITMKKKLISLNWK